MEPSLGSRLAEIEALLRRHPAGLTSSELATFLEVDASTVRRDLVHLSSIGIEIRKRGRRYQINFHQAMHSLRLTPDEILALSLACRLLSRQQSDRNPYAEAAMQKLANAVRDDAPRFASYIEDAALLQRSLPLNKEYLTVLETITQAWSEGRIVNLHYRDRAGAITERRFHPFCIEPYGATNSCYTIGFDELRGTIRTFKLDRVVMAEISIDRFDIPPSFNANRMFSEAWGVVWHETPPQMVELLFEGEAARIVQEAFWHPSQRIVKQQHETCRITFYVSEPLEMITWIRQWGASVEVIFPPRLREAIVADAIQVMEHYKEHNSSATYDQSL